MKVGSKFVEKYFLLIFKDKDELEIILYGLKILGTSILTALLVFLTGIFIGKPGVAIIYLVVLILLRRNVGGYHSKTYLGCLFITIWTYVNIVDTFSRTKNYTIFLNFSSHC